MTSDASRQASDEPAQAGPELPRFVGGKPRSRDVLLDWPLQYDGKIYDRITVRRMTTAEVGEFVAAASTEAGSDMRLPMFDCPPEIIDALDPDDAEKVNEAVRDFLPRLLRQADAPNQQNGENIPR
ncbi:phage tail assembly protein [Bradyrhizobium sp. HKCCYLS2038]|uniref:phage tail assembly protein n=1 Tax=Bradyrhizobium sp. HKCCYLS2038 TaxID=3420764 RepID=UPI003EBB4AE0